ncbi:hypothetical protein JCM10207_006909 [Rhodosporidiobolus poonsookiae]
MKTLLSYHRLVIVRTGEHHPFRNASILATATAPAAFFSSLASHYSVTPAALPSLPMPTSTLDAPAAATYIREDWNHVKGGSDHITFAQDGIDGSSGEETVLQVAYEKGRYGGNNGIGALQLAVHGERKNRAMVSYEVGFSDGFDFVLGGKLPGILLLTTPDVARRRRRRSLRLRTYLRLHSRRLEHHHRGRYPKLEAWKDLVFRINESVFLTTFDISTFFGGSNNRYSATSDCYTQYRNFRFWDGDEASSAGGNWVNAAVQCAKTLRSPAQSVPLGIAFFSGGDWIGRVLLQWEGLQFTNWKVLMGCSIARIVFIPLFLISNQTAGGSKQPVINSDLRKSTLFPCLSRQTYVDTSALDAQSSSP